MTSMYQTETDIGKATDVDPDRVAGWLRARVPGATVVFFGGIHGNEPAGLRALERVLYTLEGTDGGLEAGTLVGIRGNLKALRDSARYLDRDLNRIWLPGYLPGAGSSTEKKRFRETGELLEIHALLGKVLAEGTPPFYFIDLHTTSSESPPFVTMNDAVINRKFASLFPVPVILGIEEYLTGPLLNYINELGYVSLGFESGKHEDPAAVENAEDFIWQVLAHTGVYGRQDSAGIRERNERLSRAAGRDHYFYEVVYRHHLDRPETFTMEPGFRSFQRVPRDTLLGFDRGKPVQTRSDSIVFMPLYQEQGEEGFFLIRRIPAWALRFSSWLRRFRIHHVLAGLPGIRWAAPGSDTLLVNLRIARFFSKKLFHLLGYRVIRQDRTHLQLSNRERSARTEAYEDEFWFRRKSSSP